MPRDEDCDRLRARLRCQPEASKAALVADGGVPDGVAPLAAVGHGLGLAG